MSKQAYQLAQKHELYGSALQILLEDVRDPCKDDLYNVLEKAIQDENAETILRKFGHSLVQLVCQTDQKSNGAWVMSFLRFFCVRIQRLHSSLMMRLTKLHCFCRGMEEDCAAFNWVSSKKGIGELVHRKETYPRAIAGKHLPGKAPKNATFWCPDKKNLSYSIEFSKSRWTIHELTSGGLLGSVVDK